jgi:UDP-glucose 4-epimerase
MVPIPSSLLELIFKAGGRPEAYDSVVGSMELDLSKVRATGWQPLLPLDQGLHLALTSGAT